MTISPSQHHQSTQTIHREHTHHPNHNQAPGPIHPRCPSIAQCHRAPPATARGAPRPVPRAGALRRLHVSINNHQVKPVNHPNHNQVPGPIHQCCPSIARCHRAPPRRQDGAGITRHSCAASSPLHRLNPR